MGIKEIESLDEYQAFTLAEDTMSFKGHDIYFVDFGGYFGYSYLVFLNGGYLHYANDYQLHHPGKTKEELHEYYLEALKRKLFSEEDMTEVKSYDDYRNKENYVRNYYGMQKPYISIFFIGSEKEREKRRKATESMYYDSISFAYYDDKDFIIHHVDLYMQLQEAKKELEKNYDFWVDAFQKEMNNYEYIISERKTEILNALDVEVMDDLKKKAWKEAESKYYKAMEELGY